MNQDRYKQTTLLVPGLETDSSAIVHASSPLYRPFCLRFSNPVFLVYIASSVGGVPQLLVEESVRLVHFLAGYSGYRICNILGLERCASRLRGHDILSGISAWSWELLNI
jgi:hypothetical protein